MLSVVIIDDEHAVVELIKNLIDCPYVSIVGEAQDGISGYEIIAERRPDVVITDIYMPGIHGIKLVERVKSEFPETEFIIISGHRDFEDARGALRFGVREYLLKPVKKAELNQLLYRLAEKRLNITDAERQNTLLRFDFERNTRALRRECLYRAFTSDRPFSGSEPLGPDAERLFRFTADRYLIMALKCDFLDPQLGGGLKIDSFMEKLCERMCTAVGEDAADAEYCVDGTAGYILINHGGADTRQWCKTLLGILKTENYKYNSLRLSLAAGMTVSKADGLNSAYISVTRALDCRINPDSGVLFEYDALPAELKRVPEVHLPEADKTALRRDLESLCGEAAVTDIGRMIDGYCSANGKNLSGIYRYAGLIVDYIGSVVSALIARGEDVPEADGAACMGHIESCCTAAAVRQLLIDYADGVVNSCARARQENESRPVRAAKAYVEKNYSMPIRLEDAAAEVHFNPVYLSRLFKAQTGMGFSDYVTKVRIEHAKRFLRETDSNVGETAAQVGYADIKYFSRLFLKETGIKPKLYKKFYS